MQEDHSEKYQRILQTVLQGPSAAGTGGDEPVVAGSSGGGEVVPAPTFKVFDSLQALEKEEQIACRCASEAPGVELIKTASGKMFLLSDKKKILPMLTLLGGCGSGKWLIFV